MFREDRREDHRRDKGHGVGLEEVGGHAGAVADIVAHIVSDRRCVARVILGNTGFDLTDQVAAHVGTLGEDTAAEPGKDRDQRGTKPEGDKGVDDMTIIVRQAHRPGQDVEVSRNTDQGEAGDQHPGDRA